MTSQKESKGCCSVRKKITVKLSQYQPHLADVLSLDNTMKARPRTIEFGTPTIHRHFFIFFLYKERASEVPRDDSPIAAFFSM